MHGERCLEEWFCDEWAGPGELRHELRRDGRPHLQVLAASSHELGPQQGVQIPA